MGCLDHPPFEQAVVAEIIVEGSRGGAVIDSTTTGANKKQDEQEFAYQTDGTTNCSSQRDSCRSADRARCPAPPRALNTLTRVFCLGFE
jgi:hypothetical protein